MASILRNYGIARENGYFKLEQEADVQRHKRRLVKEGKISKEEEAAAAAGGHRGSAQQQGASRGKGFEESVHAYEVLPEVLQQQARVDDPNAAARQEYELRIKGVPPELSEAEALKYRSRCLGVGAALGHVPRMSLGRNRWQPMTAEGLAGGGAMAVTHRQLSPEAREVAARTYLAGLRSLVYGSLLGALGVAALGSWAVWALGIRSGEDVRTRVRSGFEPMAAAIQARLLPVKESANAWLGGNAATGGGRDAPASGNSGTAEFQRRLSERYNPKKVAAGAEAG